MAESISSSDSNNTISISEQLSHITEETKLLYSLCDTCVNTMTSMIKTIETSSQVSTKNKFKHNSSQIELNLSDRTVHINKNNKKITINVIDYIASSLLVR